MTMEAIRDFEPGQNYNPWKLGDKHSMFVRFVYHDRRELAGESAEIVLDLSEKVEIEPEETSEEFVDSEINVLPGVTTVVEPEIQKQLQLSSGTTWPIQLGQLGEVKEEDGKLTLGPATLIVAGVIFVSILAMIIGSAICCYRRHKKGKDEANKVRSRKSSIIVERVSPRNGSSDDQESNVPK